MADEIFIYFNNIKDNLENKKYNCGDIKPANPNNDLCIEYSQDEPDIDIGYCCFCNEPCNPCSQSCGMCARRVSMMTFRV